MVVLTNTGLMGGSGRLGCLGRVGARGWELVSAMAVLNHGPCLRFRRPPLRCLTQWGSRTSSLHLPGLAPEPGQGATCRGLVTCAPQAFGSQACNGVGCIPQNEAQAVGLQGWDSREEGAWLMKTQSEDDDGSRRSHGVGCSLPIEAAESHPQAWILQACWGDPLEHELVTQGGS